MDKNFYVFAGVNGSGKSTLYQTNLLSSALKGSIRINTDEIVNTFGDWKNDADQIKAGKMAVQLRNECFQEGKSFNEETTLTGKTILKAIDKARNLGYKVHLHYMGVNSPEISKKRIKNRVLRGGHDIPSDVVEKRYYESLENLEKILHMCDVIEIYDNSEKFYRVFYYENNKIFLNNLVKTKWVNDNLKEQLENLEI